MASSGILVVDDDEMVLEILSRRLIQQGYDVSVASGGPEAWDMVQRRDFEVLITDLNMPTMTGQELIEKVKAHSPSTVVIVLTGQGSLDSALESIHAGCDEFLLKPLPDIKEIDLVVKRCLDRHRLLVDALACKQVITKAAEGLGGPAQNLLNATNGLVLSLKQRNTDKILACAEAVQNEIEYIVCVAEELAASSRRLKAGESPGEPDGMQGPQRTGKPGK
jgi:DNA-binding response OmpR family regulator